MQYYMKKLGILALLMAWIVFTANGQFTETKEVNKRFKISPDAKIEISNKYGKIDLTTWDKDSVAINISIRIEEKKLSKLEETLRNIDFDITSTDHFLVVRTILKSGRNPFEDEIQRL